MYATLICEESPECECGRFMCKVLENSKVPRCKYERNNEIHLAAIRKKIVSSLACEECLRKDKNWSKER